MLLTRFLLLYMALLLFKSEANGQIGINALVEPIHEGYGVSIYLKNSKPGRMGTYAKLQGLLTNPKKTDRHESFVIASVGLIKVIKPGLMPYFAVGPSWRAFYSHPIGNQLEKPRVNFSAGVIFARPVSTSPLSSMDFQIGLDTRPLGVILAVGFQVNLPYHKNSPKPYKMSAAANRLLLASKASNDRRLD